MTAVKSFFFKRINYAPLLAIAFINFIFLYKYLARVNEYALPVSIGYFCFFIFIPYIIHLFNKELFPYIILLLLIIVTAFYILLLNKIPVHTLNVDRWSVIKNFWDSLLQGQYPYTSRSHMNNLPGAFPFYFVLSFPFYYINEVGYFPILSILIFAWYIYVKCEREKALLMLFILLLSACIAWEVVSRSTIFANSIILFIYLHSLVDADLTKKRNLILYGLAGGLVLSIRSLAAMPIILVFSFLFVSSRKWRQMFTLGITLCISFVCTFVPLFVYYPALFIKQNPIVLQSIFLPFYVMVIFMLIAFVLGLAIKNKYSFFLYSGFIVFACVLVYFITNTLKYGIDGAYFRSLIDISYSIFSFPFLLFCVYKPLRLPVQP